MSTCDTVAGLMGDYASESPPGLLTLSRHQEHPTELADLLGKRLVVGLKRRMARNCDSAR